jgi:hypothetical protein
MKEEMWRDDMREFGEIPWTTGTGYFSSVKRRAWGRGLSVVVVVGRQCCGGHVQCDFLYRSFSRWVEETNLP